MSYTPTNTKNLYKHPYFRYPKKGLKGYKKYNNAMLQIKMQQNGIISPKQFEASRRLLSKLRKDTDAILTFKHIQVTQSKKPLQTRMGKGKGKPFSKWSLPSRKGFPIIGIYNWFDAEKFKTIYTKMKKKYKTPLKAHIYLPTDHELLEEEPISLAWASHSKIEKK